MREERILDALGKVDENYIQEADPEVKAKRKAPAWMKWAAMAACLCLVVAAAIPTIFRQPAESPQDTVNPGEGPSNLVVGGIRYFISPQLAVADELPYGFELAGEASVGGFENCPYYTNADVPEWVYVSQEVRTNGVVDATGTLVSTEPHNAYVRYVDERLRGKDLVCHNGDYYISMWSADIYGAHPDVSSEYYHLMESAYGVRVEGNAPEGFVSAGVAEFSGHDTIPRGVLACNAGAYEIYVNPSEPDLIFVSTNWYTAAADENGETKHEGFHVYVRYDCPMAESRRP